MPPGRSSPRASPSRAWGVSPSEHRCLSHELPDRKPTCLGGAGVTVLLFLIPGVLGASQALSPELRHDK